MLNNDTIKTQYNISMILLWGNRMKRSSLSHLFFVFIIFGILTFVSVYLMDSTFFNTNDIQSYKEDVMLQTFSLATIFLLITFFYSLFLYIRKQKRLKNEQAQVFVQDENERLKASLTVDLLTNVANKKYFDEQLDKEFKRAIREKQTLSLLMVDIDEYRAFVDIYGQNDANECLKLIANILLNHCNRPTDLVARIGEDQFYVLLPNTSDPKIVSNKCVKSVEKMGIVHENSIASNVVTISVGTSTIRATNIKQKTQLLNHARQSLEKAKKSGRNRVD